jgi:hypothetical protein
MNYSSSATLSKNGDISAIRGMILLAYSVGRVIRGMILLAYSVGRVSWFMERQRKSHLVATKRVLRCCKGTINVGLMYPRKKNNKEV